jgi:hypothetical protein
MSVEVLLLHDAKALVVSESWDLKHRRARRSSWASACSRIVVPSLETASAGCLDVARARRHARKKLEWSREGTMLLLAIFCVCHLCFTRSAEMLLISSPHYICNPEKSTIRTRLQAGKYDGFTTTN